MCSDSHNDLQTPSTIDETLETLTLPSPSGHNKHTAGSRSDSSSASATSTLLLTRNTNYGGVVKTSQQRQITSSNKAKTERVSYCTNGLVVHHVVTDLSTGSTTLLNTFFATTQAIIHTEILPDKAAKYLGDLFRKNATDKYGFTTTENLEGCVLVIRRMTDYENKSIPPGSWNTWLQIPVGAANSLRLPHSYVVTTTSFRRKSLQVIIHDITPPEPSIIPIEATSSKPGDTFLASDASIAAQKLDMGCGLLRSELGKTEKDGNSLRIARTFDGRKLAFRECPKGLQDTIPRVVWDQWMSAGEVPTSVDASLRFPDTYAGSLGLPSSSPGDCEVLEADSNSGSVTLREGVGGDHKVEQG